MQTNPEPRIYRRFHIGVTRVSAYILCIPGTHFTKQTHTWSPYPSACDIYIILKGFHSSLLGISLTVVGQTYFRFLTG